ncbi:MAG: hypothetical protein OHK93_003965 [Ramalina farinacea]|uniref:Uncharacterized protein n=1 Tax=Ramalina farinacea TaxID=258253 RepID=A0AA43TNT3_9LECA|nr:hypothetical protein [Ramalina farinacea]
MSPTEEHNSTSSDKALDTSLTNPFVAFRHFADNGLSSVFNMVLGSGFLDLNPDTRIKNSKSELYSCLRDLYESKARLARQIELRNKARLMEANAARKEMLYPPHQAPRRIVACPYVNAEAEHLSPQERNDLNTFLSSQRAPAQPSDDVDESGTVCPPHRAPPRPFIPLHWLFYNHYSPLHLEQEDPPIAYRTGWRAAFEDLIYVQNGQGLSEYPDEASNSAEPPLDWIENMINLSFSKHRRSTEAYGAWLDRMRDNCDASFDEDRNVEYAPSFAGASRPAVAMGTLRERLQNEADGAREDDGDDEDADNRPSTEADLYERLKDDEYSPRMNAKSHMRQDVSHGSAGDSSGTSLLSTMTTTEKTTLSDGTVHTKMVLKKRFADGREESTETTHTQNALSRNEATRTELSDSTKGQLEGGKERKGWFWS